MVKEPVWVTRYVTDQWKKHGVLEVPGEYNSNDHFLYKEGSVWRYPPDSAVFESKLLAMQHVVQQSKDAVRSAKEQLAKAQHRYEELKAEYKAEALK